MIRKGFEKNADYSSSREFYPLAPNFAAGAAPGRTDQMCPPSGRHVETNERYPLQLIYHQCDHAFKMPGLREEVEGLNVREGVAGREEAFEIAHLGRGVSRNVIHGAGGESEELGEEALVAALAGRVDDDRGLDGREGVGAFGRGEGRKAGEDRRNVAG